MISLSVLLPGMGQERSRRLNDDWKFVRDSLAGALVRARGLCRECIHAPVGISVVVGGGVCLSIYDPKTTLRGSCIIQIDKRLSINLPIEPGELFS